MSGEDANIVIGIEGRVEGGKVVQRTLDDIDKSGAKAKKGVSDLKDEFTRTDGAAKLLANTMRVLGVAFGLRQLQQVVDTYTNIQNRLKLVTNNASELVGVTKALFEISNSTRQSFESTAEVYARVALATKEMGLSQRDTLQFTESLNQAVALSGASSAEASAGLIQLSQGLASGTLRGDELRSVLEQLPAVADVIAKGLGVTRGELRKMGEEGKITADQVIKAFALARVELEENFAKTVPTIGQAFTVLRNRFIEFVGELDKSTGASTTLAKLIIMLSKNLDTLSAALFIAAGAWGAYRAAALLALGATVLTAVAGNVTAFIQLAATVRTLTGATALLNAAFMTGPGALVAVLGAAGAAAWVFRKELEASLIWVVAEAIILVDKLLIKLQQIADFGTTNLGATMAWAANGFKTDDALNDALADMANNKKKFSGASGFSTEQLRNETDAMVAGLSSKSGPKGSVSTVGGTPAYVAPVADKEAEKAQKAIDNVTNSLKFQLEQLKRNDTEQAIYNNLKQAGVSLDSAAGKNISELTRQLETNSEQLEKQKRVIDGVAGATEGFFKSWLTGAEGFKGAVKGMIGTLADLAFQLLVVDKIKANFTGNSSPASGIFGALLNGIGGLFGSANYGASSLPKNSAGATVGTYQVPKFANGGSMTIGGIPGIDRNELSLNGAPIAKVGRGETLSVTPKGGGGQPIVVHQNINLSMGVAEAVAQQFTSFLPQISKATQSAIEEAQMRGIRA
jgi:tape measure domain-containing protein